MEYESMIGQINDLEECQRNENVKYRNEAAKHATTKGELEKVERELERSCQKNEMLEDRMVELTSQNENIKKSDKQLRIAIKDVKEENARLKDSVKREIEDTKQKRSEFLRLSMEVEEKYRTIFERMKKHFGDTISKPSPMEISEEGNYVDIEPVMEKVKDVEQCVIGANAVEMIDSFTQTDSCGQMQEGRSEEREGEEPEKEKEALQSELNAVLKEYGETVEYYNTFMEGLHHPKLLNCETCGSPTLLKDYLEAQDK